MEKNILEEYEIVPLTPDQALERIKAAANDEDQEQGHIDADDALCGLLLQLGFTDIVDKYLEIPKWYA